MVGLCEAGVLIVTPAEGVTLQLQLLGDVYKRQLQTRMGRVILTPYL